MERPQKEEAAGAATSSSTRCYMPGRPSKYGQGAQIYHCEVKLNEDINTYARHACFADQMSVLRGKGELCTKTGQLEFGFQLGKSLSITPPTLLHS